MKALFKIFKDPLCDLTFQEVFVLGQRFFGDARKMAAAWRVYRLRYLALVALLSGLILSLSAIGFALLLGEPQAVSASLLVAALLAIVTMMMLLRKADVITRTWALGSSWLSFARAVLALRELAPMSLHFLRTNDAASAQGAIDVQVDQLNARVTTHATHNRARDASREIRERGALADAARQFGFTVQPSPQAPQPAEHAKVSAAAT